MRLLNWIVRLACFGTSLAGRPSKVPKGFVTTKGPEFRLDGKPFYFVGANSYWLPHLTNQEDVDATFKEMKDAGIKVLRTWGFNSINATELEGAQKSGLTYYQVWDGPRYKLNDGPQGLGRLDKVIETAGKYGIKVIVTFTNNWSAYGGSNFYTTWVYGQGATHDTFYTDRKVIAEFQRYVRTLVRRYRNSPNIFAWELMNEARCRGDDLGGPACVAGSDMITKWYKEQSDFVRSLDPHHLITTGGEGHFFKRDQDIGYWLDGKWISDYNYNGQAGEDFDKDLTLENIDFGTYHIYPQYWYANLDHPERDNFTIGGWGMGWIQQHADSAKEAGKPVVLEEFGSFGYKNKTEIYPEWVGLALSTRHAGILPWQFGMLGLKDGGGNKQIKYNDFIIDGASPNDGFTYYKNQTEIWSVFTNAAKVQNARSK